MVSEEDFIHSSYPEVWTGKIRKAPIYQILKDFVKILEPGPNDIILEVGCGEGRFISLIVEKKATYVGSDISIRMLRYTQERLAREKMENIYLVAAEANTFHLDPRVLARVSATQPFSLFPKKRKPSKK